MQCKKCGTTMIRKEVAPHKYVYECPKCGKVVGR